jgi:hypothetical protein
MPEVNSDPPSSGGTEVRQNQAVPPFAFFLPCHEPASEKGTSFSMLGSEWPQGDSEGGEGGIMKVCHNIFGGHAVIGGCFVGDQSQMCGPAECRWHLE